MSNRTKPTTKKANQINPSDIQTEEKREYIENKLLVDAIFLRLALIYKTRHASRSLDQNSKIMGLDPVESSHLYRLLSQLSIPVEASLPIQDTKCK